MAGAGLASRVCRFASSLQVLWLAAAQGPGGFPTRHTRALRRALKISCTRAACAAWASVSVPMAGCSRSPSASARIWRIAVLNNAPLVIGPAVGPACLAGPFARPLTDTLRGGGGSGGMTCPGVALPLSLLQAGRGGPGSAAPAQGMWEEVVAGFIRVRHHALLRLASTAWVSVARAGQVDAFPAAVPDRQALLECVARPLVVGLYEGVFLGEIGSPGVIVVHGRLRSRWCDVHRQVIQWEEAPRGRRVVSSLAHGRCGTRAACVWLCAVAAGPVAGCGSGPWGATHASLKGAAEGTEDFVHKGRVCRLGFCLSADGGLQLAAQSQRPDLVDRKDGAQAGRSGVLAVRSGMASNCCWPSR